MADTREAELYALFVNGNYERGEGKGGPEMKRWEVEFTEREIEENWMAITNALRKLIKEGKV